MSRTNTGSFTASRRLKPDEEDGVVVVAAVVVVVLGTDMLADDGVVRLSNADFPSTMSWWR